MILPIRILFQQYESFGGGTGHPAAGTSRLAAVQVVRQPVRTIRQWYRSSGSRYESFGGGTGHSAAGTNRLAMVGVIFLW
ncbi:MAG: hypothetical protein KDJ65_20130 [Anaerolineae bacterium]|nr:hypothetical protein [Anaerolineae bacterium]